ncbi:hypothetical protein IRJ41_016133 [Triplophysa rosa]|uniref:Uncharacterized protein n=1 Tax=Triplophysa rosa TaxID=992332 RepID=A0A9W7TMG7_TRIRA|nr:hypothetical protein IRJ41_016133 [Triplophysa rosa]
MPSTNRGTRLPRPLIISNFRREENPEWSDYRQGWEMAAAPLQYFYTEAASGNMESTAPLALGSTVYSLSLHGTERACADREREK